MSEVFRLPDLGEGLPEAEIVQWHVAEGDTVGLNQTLADVETAKAVVELPSPFAGIVETLHAEAGAVIEVGSPLITIGVGAEPASDREPKPAALPTEDDDADAAPGPNLVGYGAAPRSTDRPRRRARQGRLQPTRGDSRITTDTAVLEAAPHDVIAEENPHDESAADPHERPRSTPPVRALARRLGVDLTTVTPSDASGVIGREDVEAAAAAASNVAAATAPVGYDEHLDARPTAANEREVRMPIRGVRKHTAAAMVASAFTAPHVTTFLTVDVTASMDLIASLRDDSALSGRRIGIMAVAAKACVAALMRHPSLNSRWDAEADEIVEYRYVNLGIAAATARGLVVPNIRDAQNLTLVELADEIAALAETARAGKSAPDAMRGGTFSITNVGVFGVDAGTPILNPGEAGILALGAVRRMPWEHRGEIALRDVMTLALSFDHRLVDGEQGARFLAEVGAVLREPGRAMLLT
ncbi:dihydrolipoamide acetyltransferase family protein [Microbacterium sp. C7(2022)]|uniref:dihydrolipoamide acetyltransferase family protein n=1 Tax=Microbacterium sp. C7(2022) TaxID=2992759 RepID=UPI00237A0F9C|nr:dihydrolipoamide acetyltransferase family protein [Microbacterium sp. C7(2022)]MDE0546845.1 2-oxo acid dehydrogenase subunit E2 [Microbacterium sp. C7(2022)]